MCKVSVIVPAYNVERYLRACLNSLAAQTLDDIEIIVVNDGSTDGSRAIAEEFAVKYPWFKVYSTENRGSSCARNYGARMSHGDYLAFVDGDDDVEPDYCKAMYEKAIRDGNDVVMCEADHVIQHNGQIRHITYPDTFWEEDNFRLTEHPYLLARMSTGPWNKLVGRELFFKVLFPEELRRSVDYPFVVKTFCLAENIGTVKRILYHYYHIHNGMTYQRFGLDRIDQITSVKQICAFMEETGLTDRFRDELEWFSVNTINWYSPMIVKKENSSWYARLRYAQEMYAYFRKSYPHWRRNPYYRETTKRISRRFYPFYYKYYGRMHMLSLIYLSRILPEGVYRQVLRADHVLVFASRYIRWSWFGAVW